jgi:hypothetical protein
MGNRDLDDRHHSAVNGVFGARAGRGHLDSHQKKAGRHTFLWVLALVNE